MKFKISVAACAVLALFTVQANAAETVKLKDAMWFFHRLVIQGDVFWIRQSLC